MAFNGDEGSVVSLNDASRWTANFRKTVPAGDIIAHFIGKEKLLDILNQEDCVGARIYYGIGDDGKKNLVFVGASADENDMVDGLIVEKVFGCPPRCSERNLLNS